MTGGLAFTAGTLILAIIISMAFSLSADEATRRR